MRGEYKPIGRGYQCAWELPPRARRIQGAGVGAGDAGGTTSACAENTIRSCRFFWQSRNYLRVRGEYPGVVASSVKARELPPRARRIRDAETGHFATLGTTSACAENTALECAPARDQQNYLRVRGEYTGPVAGIDSDLELPPRARRIQPGSPRRYSHDGTTSACAENTCNDDATSHKSWNYLRVRGEYSPIAFND